MPTDGKETETVTFYKAKGDPLEFGSYNGIRLLENAFKIFEKVLEKRLRQ